MRVERIEPLATRQLPSGPSSVAAHCVEIVRPAAPGAVLEKDLTSAEYRQCLFVMNGAGTITLDGLSWELAPGMLAVVPNRCLCILKLHRGPHLGFAIGIMKVGWHHADDYAGLVIQPDLLPDHAAVAAELRLP